MQIKSLALFNFRIYKGANTIDLSTKGDKNIIVISGKNGFGKTTFLMSLVWCLYGKNMNEVDEFYDEQIKSQGGYPKYISNSLNRQARFTGESLFYVSMSFSGLDIQAIPCKEITIRRAYDIQSSVPEKLEILFDGQPNELINEYGAEHFIRDFIIPLESAKFFFFDAEKIVSLAEANDVEQQKKLSKAYSEVLGIKKYEDLTLNLNNLHLRYKQDSATVEDKKKLIELRSNEQKNDLQLEADKRKIQDTRELIDQLRYDERQIQQKLIQESNVISSEELAQLQNRSDELQNQIEEQRKQLNELLEIAPFAIAGDNLMLISEQAEKEAENNKKQFKDDEVDSKTEKVLYELDHHRVQSDIVVHTKIQEFYNQTLRKLIRKHFFDLTEDAKNEDEKFHEFNEVELYELQSLIGNLKQSFRNQFKIVNQAYSSSLAERNNIAKKISDAESKEEDGLIKDLRDKQKEYLRKISNLEEEIIQLSIKINVVDNEQTQIKSQISGLAKKLILQIYIRTRTN